MKARGWDRDKYLQIEPSPKRLTLAAHEDEENDNFVVHDEEEATPEKKPDEVSFDDHSSESFEYSDESCDDSFELPEYAAKMANLDARKTEGTYAGAVVCLNMAYCREVSGFISSR